MSENQPAAPSRNWSDITEAEQRLIKLFYMQGESLATVARIWNINYHGLRGRCYQQGWHKERDEGLNELTTKETALKHVNFMHKVFDMMERIHAGFSELLERNQLHDHFQSFPFDKYYQFLEMYAKSVDLLGGVKTISNDVTMYLQQNVQNNLNINDDKGEHGEHGEHVEHVVPLNDRESKSALSKILQSIVMKQRPPEPKEIQADTVSNDDDDDDDEQPDPAQGRFR